MAKDMNDSHGPREVPRCACPEATLYREALERVAGLDPSWALHYAQSVVRAALSRVQSAESAERGERP